MDRLVDSFKAEQQAQARMQLSMVLQSVVSQQLIPTIDGNVWPVFEIMISTPAIRNMIREGRSHQMSAIINTGAAEGMISMDASLLALYQQNIISAEEMLIHALAPEALAKQAGI